MAAPTSSPGHRASESTSPRWPWVALPVGIVVIVVWPLQALAIAMLATTALMLVSIYAVFVEHRAVPDHLRPRLDRQVPIIVGAALAVGILLTTLWPSTVTPVAFALLVLACVGWLLSEWLLGRRDRPERDPQS